MKKRFIITAATVLGLGAMGALHAALDGLDMYDLGLSRTSVFDIPAPETFQFPQNDPGRIGVLPRGYEGAPPQIPHRVDTFLPVTLKQNMCMNCHNQPSLIGQKRPGMPTPMSASHYIDEGGKLVMNNRRYTCVDCHVPQADVAPLVGSTF